METLKYTDTDTDTDTEINNFFIHIDNCDEKGILGGVAHKYDFNQFINIDIFIDNEFIINITADLFRKDLLEAKIGDGKHAFKLPMPIKFFDNLEHTLEIKKPTNK